MGHNAEVDSALWAASQNQIPRYGSRRRNWSTAWNYTTNVFMY
jgi:hypothetical protein